MLQLRDQQGWAGDFHKYPHVEPLLWTGIALGRLRALGNQAAVENEKELWETGRMYRVGPTWQEFPRPVIGRPSLYATSLALLALLEATTGSGRWDAELSGLVAETASWLALQVQNVGSQLEGWVPEIGSSRVSNGVSLLAAYALLRARREMRVDVGFALQDYVPALFRKVGSTTPNFDLHDGHDFVGGTPPNLITHQVRITWSPWALGCAFEWERAYGATAPAADTDVVRGLWADLLLVLEKQNLESTYAFMLAEHLYVMAQVR